MCCARTAALQGGAEKQKVKASRAEKNDQNEPKSARGGQEPARNEKKAPDSEKCANMDPT